MESKSIAIKEDVYKRLKAHKRDDESFSETLDRIMDKLDSDWRTNAGFLADEEAADLEAEVNSGLGDLDNSFVALGDEIGDQLREDS
jgi:predicted CopG family antitoxin